MTTVLTAGLVAAAAFIAGALVVAALAGRAPRWVAGIVYRARGKRLVRVHVERRLEAQAGVVGESDMTVEGLLLGRWSGMYVLTRASVVGDDDDTVSLLGDVEIPADRVIFLQTIGRGR